MRINTRGSVEPKQIEANRAAENAEIKNKAADVSIDIIIPVTINLRPEVRPLLEPACKLYSTNESRSYFLVNRSSREYLSLTETFLQKVAMVFLIWLELSGRHCPRWFPVVLLHLVQTRELPCYIC